MQCFRVFGVLAASVGLITLVACKPDKHDWIVIAGVRVGPITASTSGQDLRKVFGNSAVIDKDVDVGEGMTEPGTVIYESTPGKRLAILWKDPATRKNPARVMICYQQLQGDCMWRTSNGFGMNTSLKDLERLNGRPFKLLGFGWDYSGTVSSWDGGALTNSAGRLLVRLTPDEAGTNSEEYQGVLGEGEFPSSHPAMQKLNPKIYDMELEFPQ